MNAINFRCSSRRTRDHRGVALVIVLVFIVLLTGIMVAFLSRSISDRQVSNSSASLAKVNLLAQGALDVIVGDLKQEIVAGSTAATVAGTTIYSPSKSSTSTYPTMVPALVGVLPTDSAVNLVKRSAYGKPFFTGAGYTGTGLSRAANLSSLISSQNGRAISAARWNKPLLLPKANLGSDTDLTPDGATSAGTWNLAPNWILVSRDGTNPTAWNSNLRFARSGAATSNDKSVLGRYAYMIYDEGGLLDINAVGYPSNYSASEFSSKGSLAHTDVRLLPGIASLSPANQTKFMDQLVGWRNYGSAAVSSGNLVSLADLSGTPYTFSLGSSYRDYLRTTNTGFMWTSSQAGPGTEYDRMFGSRQELLAMFQRLGSGSTTAGSGAAGIRAQLQSSLQYFGTFYRWVTAPSVSRDVNRPMVSSPGSGGNNAQGLDDEFNPTFPKILVTKGFTRLDGTVAQIGEPLIKHRFALNRLAWLTAKGPSASLYSSAPSDPIITALVASGFSVDFIKQGTAANITNYFGLSYAGSTWTYSHGDPSRILRFKDLQALREPDFFELLQAAIAVGSLGKSAGTGTLAGASANARDQVTSYQIMQIAADLMDQYDSDGYPTTVSFDSRPFYGIENLPYLNRARFMLVRIVQSAVSTYAMYAQPEIWNPHDVSAANFPPPGNRPLEYRVVCSSNGIAQVVYAKDKTLPGGGTYLPWPGAQMAEGSSALKFTSALDVREPVLLDRVNNTNGPMLDSGSNALNAPVNTNNWIGMFLQQKQMTNTNAIDYYWDNSALGLTFKMQYKNAAGSWITYSERQNIQTKLLSQVLAPGTDTASVNNNNNAAKISAADPRSDRFSFQGGNGQYADTSRYPFANKTIRPDAGLGWGGWTNKPAPGYGWNVGIGNNNDQCPIGCISQNTTANSSATSYTDADTVLRGADGMYFTGSGLAGLMHGTGNFDSRPVVINRPFRTVAEMGYAFRGTPCKSLDFFSPNSADAGLLDVFSINDEPPEGVIAGHFNLNSRNPEVAKAVLQGALRTAPNGSSLTSIEADSIAQKLKALSSAAPFRNKSELVTRLMDSASGLPASSDDTVIKRRREAPVRALGDVTETRTWNLFIDVIAQTGRYGPAASGLSQFLVEGERRYWMHVAIDRWTGKVIAKQSELVNE